MKSIAILIVAAGAFVGEDKPNSDRQKLEKEAQAANARGAHLYEQERFAEAIPHMEQALAIRRKLFPIDTHSDGHADIADSLNWLGLLHQSAGSREKALPYCEEAVKMQSKLFPKAHRERLVGIINLATLYRELGVRNLAKRGFESGLAMSRDLSPLGSPETVNCLLQLVRIRDDPQYHKSNTEMVAEALELSRRLYPVDKYPDGHPYLAYCLNDLAMIHARDGKLRDARLLLKQANDMNVKFYPKSNFPDGHDNLAKGLKNLGQLCLLEGDTAGALDAFDRAMSMTIALLRRSTAMASDTEALDRVRQLGLSLDLVLDFSRFTANRAAVDYRFVWAWKAGLSRVLEKRHASARAAATANAERLDALRNVRRRIELILQDRRLQPAERDRLLAAASAQRDDLERALARSLPELERSRQIDQLGPEALASILPRGAVFIDFVQYMRQGTSKEELARPDKSRTSWYTAFVTVPGKPVRRIEVGEAKRIDAAIDAWRGNIERGVNDGGHEVRKLVWDPLQSALPPETNTVYIASENHISRIPWVAIPLSADRVLLENLTIASVPHGSFLLGAVKFPRAGDNRQALLVGDVDYAGSSWLPLPGSQREVQAIHAIEPDRVTSFGGRQCTSQALASELVRAGTAHLAVHGQFDAEGFAAEQRRWLDHLRTRKLGSHPLPTAHRNPLGYVGIVLTGGEIMTGLAIVDLNLEKLDLVVLSACETGLGEYTGGKGVENLQMAFHVAGAQNVIASLWKVSDAATAALMAKFYHELWVNKKPPIEALREAQLFIYYNPDKIPDVLGERGAPRRNEALAVRAGSVSDGSKKRADTKLWAAFVLSGVGK